MERKGLGRGLSALMSDMNLQRNVEPGTHDAQLLPIDRLYPNPDQPRQHFDQEALDSLADSIRHKGIIQPLVVRPRDDDYEIVAGERRWRAAQIAQLHEVPVVIRNFSDSEVLEIAIIENIQREDLNAIEEALGLKSLIERFGHTQEQLAEALSKSRSHIANLLRLLNLPDEVQHMVQVGKLSAGHARALIGAPDSVNLAKKVMASGLSVRQTEKLIRDKTASPRQDSYRDSGRQDADTLALEKDLGANLGMVVSIKDNGGKGLVTVRYNDLEELDLLCQLLSSATGRMARG